jgi:triosephosphate isomerase
MKKGKIVIANWKMKLSLAETLKLAKDFKSKFKDFKEGEVAACPNFISLMEVKEILKGCPVKLGAQHVFWEDKGAYTGEISPNMLKEAGCEYVIVGHSERRKYRHENYEMIHQETKAVLNTEGLTPIVCIGEDTEQRKTEKRDFVLVDQLYQALAGFNLMGDQEVIIAYEPIWAIGSGLAIEPEEAEYAHKIIKLSLRDIFGPKIVSENFRIIYGGSISSKNVKEFANLDGVDGLLVGGASLDAEEFYKIAKAILK